MKTYALLILFVVSFSVAEAQDVPFHRSEFPEQRREFRKARKAKNKGMRLASRGPHRYQEALDLMRTAHQFNPNNSVLNWHLGELIFHGDHTPDALPYLYKAWKLDSAVSPELPLMLAKVMHLHHRFGEARQFYTHYHASLRPRQARRWNDTYEKYMQQVNTADSLVTMKYTTAQAEVTNPGNRINSSYPEYGPVPVPGGQRLWFTSRRPGSTGGKTDKNNMHFEDIYYLEKIGEIWSDPINAGRGINTDDHESVVAVSSDQSEVYIRRGDPNGNLFLITGDGQRWRRQSKLPRRLRSRSNDSWIAFSPDSTRVWFVSDRRGGYGGKDIWMSELNARGRWSRPVNAGPEINTPYDEESPFMAADGKTLFFSSQGHTGMGGFDVFVTTFHEGEYTPPINLGYPINTAGNDLHFSWCPETGQGWMSSDRTGGFGNYDLYEVTMELLIPFEIPDQDKPEDEENP